MKILTYFYIKKTINLRITLLYKIMYYYNKKGKKLFKSTLIQDLNLDQDIRSILLYHWANKKKKYIYIIFLYF